MWSMHFVSTCVARFLQLFGGCGSKTHKEEERRNRKVNKKEGVKQERKEDALRMACCCAG